jgi:hypothetical protein
MCMTDYSIPQPPKKAEDVPIGDGLAQRARLAIQTRSRRIDEAVNSAQSGKPPRQ